jgi:hypothetical protein
MITLPTDFIKHPCVDGLLYLRNNGPPLAFQPTGSPWIVARICNVAFILCLYDFDLCWMEALLISFSLFSEHPTFQWIVTYC